MTNKKRLAVEIGARFEFLCDNFDKPADQDWDSWLDAIVELEGRPAAWDAGAGYVQGYLDGLGVRPDDAAQALGLPPESKALATGAVGPADWGVLGKCVDPLASPKR